MEEVVDVLMTAVTRVQKARPTNALLIKVVVDALMTVVTRVL